MAGIGFRIEKILSGDTYIDVIRAHFYSAIIFSGPWLMSIMTMFCLGYFSPRNISIYDIVFFRTMIIYIFAFSLAGVGFLHLSLTRYLSDKLYSKDEEALTPIFNSSILLILVIQALTGIIACLFLDVSLSIKFLILMTYMTISALWVVMIFLTALRDYKAITIIFLMGSLVTIFGCVFLGRKLGLDGYFMGYFVGHFMITAMLATRTFIEFHSKKFFDWGLFTFLIKNKVLLFLGLFYNLAIWIDKMVFWFSPKAVKVKNFLYSFPLYESTTFFAFLTIIPALSIFLIHIETDFYRKYKTYYSQILNKGTFSDILQAKKEMMASLRKSIVFVVTCQGVISILAILFVDQFANILRLQAIQIPMYRLAVVGAFLNSLLLIAIIIILYFDFKVLALAVTIIFFLGNGIGTFVTSYLPLSFVGYGYIFGAITALAFAFYRLDYKLRRLEYYTFALQPVAAHREEEIV